MSITGELRKYVQDWRETPNLMDDLDAGDVDGILADFEHIADHIDAEHDEAMSRAGQLLADAEHDRDYNYANWQDCKQMALQHNITIDELEAKIECLEDELSHRMELPKDADGKPIHLGDTMCGTCPSGKYVCGEVSAIGDNEFWLRNVQFSLRPYYMQHYHKPTTEDVLCELLNEYREGGCVLEEARLSEYATKLRLADEKEQQ